MTPAARNEPLIFPPPSRSSLRIPRGPGASGGPLHVDPALAAEQVRDAPLIEERRATVRDLLREHGDGVLSSIEPDSQRSLPFGSMAMAYDGASERATKSNWGRRARPARAGSAACPGVRLHRDAADDPCVGVERGGGALVLRQEPARQGPGLGHDPPVDGGDHVTDRMYGRVDEPLRAKSEREDDIGCLLTSSSCRSRSGSALACRPPSSRRRRSSPSGSW